MGLVNDIKGDIKKSGSNKSKVIYVKTGEKVRIRFLQDMNYGIKLVFHDSYDKGINSICAQELGEECSMCGDETLRTRHQYAWCVWDYEAKEVKILLAPVNNCSPIPALVDMHETYDTILDRDYVLKKSGAGMSTSFSAVPLDKVKFKNKAAKVMTEKAILEILSKAYPNDDIEDEDDDEPEKSKKSKGKPKTKKIEEEEIDDEDDDFEDEVEVEDEEVDYEDMSVKELYRLCKERKIKCKPRKEDIYYIDLLEDYDEEIGEDEEDDDDW